MVASYAQSDELKIIVIEGDNAVNNVRRGVTTRPVVEVRDRNDKPVAGVIVTFSSPRGGGAGGQFAGGVDFVTVSTDAQGQASTTFQPNSVAGNYTIAVTASYQGLTAKTAIRQQNVVPAAAGVSGKAIGILAAIGAAAAVGAAVALGGGGGNGSAGVAPPVPSAPTTPTARIGIGTGPIVVEPRP